MTVAANPRVEEGTHTVLERIVRMEFGSAARVASISTEPSPFSSISPADIVTVGLRDGRELRVFVKWPPAEPDGNPDKAERQRELLIYKQLLGGRALPVPRFYGSRWNASSCTGDLFLEYIDDSNLPDHGLEHWLTAATRLGGLHAYFAARQDELARSTFLLRLDRQYFSCWATRALAVVTSGSHRLGQALARPLRRYHAAIELLVDQPQTLVHNDLAPKNVIADTTNSPARICFVDWEMAGVGCGFLDLVHLAHGFEAAEQRSLLSSYCRGLGSEGQLLPEGVELPQLVSACSLHNTLYRLAHVQIWGLGEEVIRAWVDDVVRFSTEV